MFRLNGKAQSSKVDCEKVTHSSALMPSATFVDSGSIQYPRTVGRRAESPFFTGVVFSLLHRFAQLVANIT
ncbi:Protein of unknown function [Gryllus bimaculatus]|nr:Protein of unknown function [Gryllus bimaculatus]